MIWILLALWLVPPLFVFICGSLAHRNSTASRKEVIDTTMITLIPIVGLLLAVYAIVATFLEYVLKWIVK